MIRTTSATSYRAAAACVAAAVLSLTATRHAAAQQTVDLFGGTFTNNGVLSFTGQALNTATGASGNFGPGFGGSVTLALGALNTISEGFTPAGASNTFAVSETSGATTTATTSAFKTYGVSLSPGATYTLTLARANGFTVNLLGSFDIMLSAGGNTFVDTATGQGLAGAVDVLSLFGANGTATLQFTVPTTATGALGLTLNSSEPINALGGSYVFQSAVISQVVPEPGSVAASLLGVAASTALCFRRRLRAC